MFVYIVEISVPSVTKFDTILKLLAWLLLYGTFLVNIIIKIDENIHIRDNNYVEYDYGVRNCYWFSFHLHLHKWIAFQLFLIGKILVLMLKKCYQTRCCLKKPPINVVLGTRNYNSFRTWWFSHLLWTVWCWWNVSR